MMSADERDPAPNPSIMNSALLLIADYDCAIRKIESFKRQSARMNYATDSSSASVRRNSIT